jgi:hypothetical protein
MGGHALVGPITGDLAEQGDVKLKAPPRRESIRVPVHQSRAGNPPALPEAAGPFRDDDLAPAATEEWAVQASTRSLPQTTMRMDSPWIPRKRATEVSEKKSK